MKTRVSTILTVLLLTLTVSAQSKSKPKKKPKSLPTVDEVARPPKTQTAEKEEWTHLTGDLSKDGKIQIVYRYQTESLAPIAPHVFKFWLEMKETEKKITYRSLFLFEVNCRTKEYRLSRHIAYDKNGTFLSDNKNKETDFDDIVPGTLAASSFSKICTIAEK